MSKVNKSVLILRVYFPKSGWTDITISGFKKTRDAKAFGEMLSDKVYPNNKLKWKNPPPR